MILLWRSAVLGSPLVPELVTLVIPAAGEKKKADAGCVIARKEVTELWASSCLFTVIRFGAPR